MRANVRRLEAAAATAAEATTREAAATTPKTRAARTAWGRGHGGTGDRRHGIQAADKHVRVETRAEIALVPLRRLGIDVLEGIAPVFLDAEGHGEGEKFFKHFRSFDHAIEAIGFDVIQEILEAKNAFERASTRLRVRGHEPAKSADDGAGKNAGDDE